MTSAFLSAQEMPLSRRVAGSFALSYHTLPQAPAEDTVMGNQCSYSVITAYIVAWGSNA